MQESRKILQERFLLFFKNSILICVEIVSLKQLAVALGVNRSVRILDLSGNQLGEACLVELALHVFKAERPFFKKISVEGFSSNIRGSHQFLESFSSSQANAKVIYFLF